jgi:hypothetical protein
MGDAMPKKSSEGRSAAKSVLTMTGGELLKAIVNELEPYKKPYNRDDVARWVRWKIDMMRGHVVEFHSRKAQRRNSVKARAIGNAATKLLRELKPLGEPIAPRDLFFDLSSPLSEALTRKRTPEELTSDLAKYLSLLPKRGMVGFLLGEAIKKAKYKNTTIEQRVAAAAIFLLTLENLQLACAEWPTRYVPRYDQAKRGCAGLAISLMDDFSTKLPTSVTARSPYRAIASLLFEAVTGQQGADLRRPCQTVLRSWRNEGQAFTQTPAKKI